MKPTHRKASMYRWVSLRWAGMALAFVVSACQSLPQTPLYQQLGGVDNISAITGQVLDRVSQDPRSSRSFKGINIRTLKRSVSDYLCQIADGPCKYEGENMKNAHAQSDITAAEFDLMVEILREELDAAGVSTAAKNELLRRLAPTYRDIISKK